MSRGGEIGSGRRGGNVGGGRKRCSPRDDFDKFRSWGDVIRWPLALVILAMLAVVVADGLWLTEVASPDIAAVATGIAAVISALAAVVEARRGGAMRDHLADHEARLRVLEDRGRRP